MVEKLQKPGRTMWSGYLKLALVSCAIALYKATSTAENVSFNGINRDTGNRLKQQMVDAVTGQVVDADKRVKGYEVGKNQYVLIEDADLEKIKPPGDKVIDLEKFVPVGSIPAAFHHERYYMLPDDQVSEEAFGIIRSALEKKRVVGIGKIVLRSRQRPVMLEVLGNGLVATTLRHSSEVRSAEVAFAGIREKPAPKELLEIATLLIDRKIGKFDPGEFVDAYEAGVIELVKAKRNNVVFTMQPSDPEPGKVVNLMEAFKASLKETAAMPRLKPAAASKDKPGKVVSPDFKRGMIAGAKSAKAAAAKKKGR